MPCRLKEKNTRTATCRPFPFCFCSSRSFCSSRLPPSPLPASNVRPCPSGVIAGGVVRAIMELGGVKDVVTKVVGRTSNSINVAWATLEAIKETRTAEEIYKLRGKKAPEPAAASAD